MKRIMSFWLLSCKKATELIEKKQVAKLSRKESVILSIHNSMCLACRSYEKQSQTINALFTGLIRKAGSKKKDNENLKMKIIKQIKST